MRQDCASKAGSQGCPGERGAGAGGVVVLMQDPLHSGQQGAACVQEAEGEATAPGAEAVAAAVEPSRSTAPRNDFARGGVETAPVHTRLGQRHKLGPFSGRAVSTPHLAGLSVMS